MYAIIVSAMKSSTTTVITVNQPGWLLSTSTNNRNHHCSVASCRDHLRSRVFNRLDFDRTNAEFTNAPRRVERWNGRLHVRNGLQIEVKMHQTRSRSFRHERDNVQ